MVGRTRALVPGKQPLDLVMTEAVDFVCPRCTSRYKLVRVRAEPGLLSHVIHRKVCKEPLPPTDGDYALKYFLVGRVRRRNGIDLGMKHSPPQPTRPVVHQQQQVQREDDEKKD
jgi:hypothetical protein